MRVTIIGGSGQMGAWFALFFKEEGFDVTIVGRDYQKAIKVGRKLGIKVAKSNLDAIKEADVIMISVLPHNFEKVIKQIAPHLKESQRVIDITSVKQFPIRIMHKYIKRGVALGTHPMFGPSAEKEGQNFVLTPTNRKEAAYAKQFGKFLKSAGFNVVTASPEEHDRMIGMMLSLTHFIGLVTGETWHKLHVEEHMKTSSTSFRFLAKFVKSVVDSSPDLYSYLQMDVKNVREVESLFIKSANKWSTMIKRKQRRKFINRMEELSSYIEKNITNEKS